MMNFCTLFDSWYLVKGLALYLSLEKVSDDFHLYVMAFDQECYDKLKEMNFSHLTVELWEEWETPEIKAVKGDRNRAEYCWTCGPSVIYHFLKHYSLPNITYLDSDLFFLGNPKIAFDEIGTNSVAITEQGISEKAEKMYGKYCVQFMFFRNDEDGIAALSWWRDSCVDWCYQRFEEDRFGDQKYLDKFPAKFNNVYVIQNPGVGIAPWNMNRYSYKEEGRVLIKNGKEYPIVFFHMHAIKSVVEGDCLVLRSSDAIINKKQEKYFFELYAELTAKIINNNFKGGIAKVRVQGIASWRCLELKLRGLLNKNKALRNLYHRIFGITEHGAGTRFN